MSKPFIFHVFLLALWLATGCVPATTVTKPAPPAYVEAKHLREGLNVLTEKLISSSAQYKVGRIAVADFIGPGDGVTALGEHISDKVSVALFSSGAFPDLVERKQLKQVLLTKEKEISGYFDQRTVQQFGNMIGVDSMVIGAIEDLGSFFDLTAKIVESSTGRLQGMADVRLIKDDAIMGLLQRERTATLTIAVDPPVDGMVMTGNKQGRLEQGMLTLGDIPYGECRVVIQSEGYETVSRNISVRSRAENLSVRLKSKQYECSFQIIPPDASLSVNGIPVPLNPQGFGKIDGLKAQECSYVAEAKGFQNLIGTFNPIKESLITAALVTNDPFYATKNIFFQKFQGVNKEQDFSVKLWTDRTNYRLKDEIYFYFRAQKDCYLNLVDINSNGEFSLLFPNRFHPDNFVKGGVTYRIPDKNYGFAFEAEPPTGTDRIYAFAGTRPLGVFDEDFSKDAFVTVTRGNTRGVKVKGIGARLDQAKLGAASECVIHISQ